MLANNQAVTEKCFENPCLVLVSEYSAPFPD